MMRRESGQVLPLVLIILFLGSILLAPVLAYNSTTLKATVQTKNSQRLLYAADAGVKDALWKLTNQFSDVQFQTSTGPFPYHLANVNDTAPLNVVIERIIDNDYAKTYKITSAAGLGSNAVSIESYVSNFSGLFAYAAVAKDTINSQPGAKIIGPISTNASGWPLLDAGFLSNYYLYGDGWQPKPGPTGPSDLEDFEIDGTIAVNGNMTLGPGYVDGNLKIDGSASGTPTIKLTGTIYVTGIMDIAKNTGEAQKFSLDLNGQTIFINGTGISSISSNCHIQGDGAIINVGDPGAPGGYSLICMPGGNSTPDDFVFIMSVLGAVNFQPSGNFYGTVAGGAAPGVSINLQPGSIFSWTPPPATGINFPMTGGTGAAWRILTWKITRGPVNELTIITITLQGGIIGVEYNPSAISNLRASGGIMPYTWSIDTATPLPEGLSLDPAKGAITGVPESEVTDYLLTVTVTDSNVPSHATATKDLYLTIRSFGIVTLAGLPDGYVGSAYNQTLAATGGNEPYVNWIITGGSLPPGLSLDNDAGTISGTPTTSGIYTFTVQVQDSEVIPAIATKEFTLIIPAPPAIQTKDAVISAATSTEATLNGRLDDMGAETSVDVFFEWDDNPSFSSPAYTSYQTRTATGDFSASITGLTLGQVYYFRVKAEGNAKVKGDIYGFVVLNPTQDSYIDSNNAGTNYGTNTSLIEGKSGGRNYNTLVQYDLSQSELAGKIINSASLNLHVTSVTNQHSANVHRISSSWVENLVTWNNGPAYNSSYITQNVTNVTNIWVNWSLTNDVQGFVNSTYTNNGWLIINTATNNSATFNSKEAITNKPVLIVTFRY